jgi:hypothetical protein
MHVQDLDAIVSSKRMTPRIAVLLLAFVGLFFASFAAAQTSQGSINGRVVDPHGLPIPRAAVAITSVDTGVQAKTVTDAAGLYNVLSLTPGTYTVEVTATGFKKQVVDKIIVGAATTVVINVPVSIGSENATVTVTSQSDLLSTSSDVSTTVDHEIVENLPYPERSSLEAVLLVPGVNGDPFSSGGIATENPGIATGSVNPGGSIQIGGAPPGTSSILVDGSDVTQASYPRTGVNLSGRDVSETTVITTGLSAKYGRTGGGVVVQGSRGGTSTYHGAITYRHTDPWFNAISENSTTKNNQHENFFGAYLGGPVYIPKLYTRRDKTFFFVGIEPARLRTVVTSRGSTFTPDELAGHFYNSITLLNSATLKTGGYAAALAQPRIGQSGLAGQTQGSSLYYHTAITPLPKDPNCAGLTVVGFPCGVPLASSAYTPITGPLTDCAVSYAVSPNPGATTCVDDVAPQLAQNPFAQAVLALYPTPANPQQFAFDNPNATYATDGTNGRYSRGVINIDNRYSFRIDHQFNNNNSIFGRYTVIPVSGTRFLALDPTNPIDQVPVDTANGHDLAFGYTHIFSSTLVNVLHYSFMRDRQTRSPAPAALTTDFAAKYGLTPANSGYGFPNLGTFNSNGSAYTIQPGAAAATTQVDQNFIGGDDLSWTKGNHLLQFGFDIRWIQSSQYDLSGSLGGKYAFTNGNDQSNLSAGGNALSTFILGEISTFSNTPIPTPGYYRWRYYAGYAQDDWRASAKLTLNLGARYEVEVPRTEKFNNQAFFYTNQPAMTLGGTAFTDGFCFSGACGTPATIWPTNYWGIEPRIGIAYAATQRTTLRASYTITRAPLSGYENTPDPNLNVAGTTVNTTNGGKVGGYTTDYISNPVGTLVSALSAFGTSRGPFYSSTGLSPEVVSQNNAVPYIQAYSLSFQFQPFQKTLVQTSYQGSRGIHLIGAFPLASNTAPIQTIVQAVQQGSYLAGTKNNTYGINNPGTTTPLTENALQQLEPYQNFFNQALSLIYPRVGTAAYNAMYLSVNQRFNRNYSFLANYTWSKSLDNVPDVFPGSSVGNSNTAVPQNPLDTSGEYAVSTFDQGSKLKAGYVAILPFGIGQRFHTGNGLVDRLIGNISTSGILTWANGFPNSVTLGTTGYFTSLTPTGTPAVNGNTACPASTSTPKVLYCSSAALPSGYTLRPNRVPGVPVINKNWRDNPYNSLATGGITPFLNSAAFSVPGSPGNPQLGTVSRTMSDARSPRMFAFDANVKKGFTIRDRYQVNVNGTFNNAFNHPIYGGLSSHTVLSSTAVTAATGAFVNTVNGNFGNMSSIAVQRLIRVGAEFVF